MEEEHQNIDNRDAYAAIFAGLSGCSESEARRSLEDFIAAASPGWRVRIEKTLESVGETYKDLPPAKRMRALKKLGKQMRRDMERRKRGLRRERLAGTGGGMLRIACLLFPKRKVVRVFLPLISDYQREYASARREGMLKAGVTAVEWWWYFAKACGLDVVLQLAGGLVKMIVS